MFDNGLLKYYDREKYPDGILKARDITLSQKEYSERMNICRAPKGVFFRKFTEEAESEVLLSQIYNKAGVPSAVYLPVKYNNQQAVLFNGLNSPGTLSAYRFFNGIDNDDEVSSKRNWLPRDFLSSQSPSELISQYFTEKAIAQQIKMRVLDVASYVSDRYCRNFFYTLNRGMIEQVSCIEFELNPLGLDSNPFGNEKWYDNDFSVLTMSRAGFLDTLKSSERVAENISLEELAQTLTSIDPKGVAEDIKETIGFEINPNFVDTLSKSYEEVAETLIK